MISKLTPLAAGIALSIAAGHVAAELQTRTVNYTVNGTDFTGYLAWDDNYEGKRPGVLVVHEWWGHNEFARDQAEKLAEAGYTAFALDMYGSGKVTDHPKEAQQFMEEATGDIDALQARFSAAMEQLKKHETVDDDHIAAQGYCFGGAVVLNMARLGMDLDGVVSYHGSLGSPIEPETGDITARIQVYTGGADQMVSAAQVGTFTTNMQEAGADFSVTSFPGVQHSFMNPGADAIAEEYGMPVGYDAEAAKRAWDGTMRFYQQIFDR
ncbi:Dienelactone hydrolase [Marinobacter daqiaonensis]|uniref:Dienelactone hydrolase n=1 Tax=Marinobacter daqiaonensis TaxID=650891 RepID=A0A1I6JR51_9GAMM|nr:dienelactone hydrolase family protein [Marinobacter daqiaonensis]SFR81454.1 Dienelactone hydrolase [Marinobacter daqiaonensis]